MRSNVSRSLLAALLGAVFYVLCRGWEHLSPRSVLWVSEGDRFINWFGWLSFFRDPWGWPLGKITSQFVPQGSFIGFTDSIPWFSLLLKLFLPFRAEPLQFLGVYQLISYSLFGYFSYRTLELFQLRLRDRYLGTSLLLFSPILIHRSIHIALCSHWEILAAFYLYLKDRRREKPAFLGWLALIIVSSATHPYLGLMTTGTALASAFSRRNAAMGASSLGAMALTFWSLGFFAIKSRADEGFELFSADILTFVNSMWLSRFLPQIRVSPSQREGFAYMGLGMLALGLLLAVQRFSNRDRSRRSREDAWSAFPGLRPLAWIAGLFAFYSLSSHVSIAGHTIFTLERLYAPFSGITGAFRSCGRFVWVLYYFLCLMIVVKVATRERFSARTKTALLAVAVLLQWADLGPAIASHREAHGSLPSNLSPAEWSAIPEGIRHLEFVPTGFPDPNACSRNFYSMPLFDRFAVFAFTRGLSSNEGYRAHFLWTDLIPGCRAQALKVQRDGWEPGVAYVFPDAGPPAEEKSLASCSRVSSVTICWR